MYTEKEGMDVFLLAC